MLHQIKAQQFYTDLVLSSLSTVLIPTKIVEFKDFSRLLSDFPVLFKADLIFKAFQESPLNSSTFQACENTVQNQEDLNCNRHDKYLKSTYMRYLKCDQVTRIPPLLQKWHVLTKPKMAYFYVQKAALEAVG